MADKEGWAMRGRTRLKTPSKSFHKSPVNTGRCLTPDPDDMASNKAADDTESNYDPEDTERQDMADNATDLDIMEDELPPRSDGMCISRTGDCNMLAGLSSSKWKDDSRDRFLGNAARTREERESPLSQLACNFLHLVPERALITLSRAGLEPLKPKLPNKNSTSITGPDSGEETNRSQRKPKTTKKSKATKPAERAKQFKASIPMIKRTAVKPYKASNKSFATTGWDEESAPMATVDDLFRALAERAMATPDFPAMLKHLNKQPIRVATMCSGSESPIIALEYFRDLYATSGYEFNFEHVFSAEIEPYKQSYITRNFKDILLFRDITEMAAKIAVNEKSTLASGAKAHIPGDIDILISGFCCVDGSPMNSKPKDLSDDGESGDTLRATRAWVKVSRPKFVLLENLKGTPWSEPKRETDPFPGVGPLFESIGYSTELLQLDSKLFGLPQTRQRGYMLCVRDDLFANITFDDMHYARRGDAASGIKSQLFEHYATLVKTMQQKASVSVETMILAMQDQNLLMANRVDDVAVDKQEVKWERCRTEHHRYRQDLKLGDRRPLTAWNDNGYKKLPDFYTMKRGLTPRVLDTMEIHHLENALRGLDSNYINRTRNLSQNVYRDTDSRPMGLVGCLLPRAQNYNTIWGRCFDGREALALNGLPVDRIDLSNLTNSQMQNLSGNAMSTTVVGACLQGLLLTFYKFIEKGDGTYQRVHKVLAPPQFVASEGSSTFESFLGRTPHHLSAADAMRYAASTAKLCSCETRHQTLKKRIKKCGTCGHTACSDHAGSPMHSYKDLDIVRGMPAEFEELLVNSLPKKISFCAFQGATEELLNFEAILNDLAVRSNGQIDRELWHQIYYAEALRSDLWLKKVTRSDVWEVVFESSAGSLVLRISSCSVEWLLYAKPRASWPGNDSRRKQLNDFPILRMCPTDGIFDVGKWHFWLPKLHEIKANVTWTGEAVPSWGHTLGLVNELDKYVLDTCIVNAPKFPSDLIPVDVRGTYHLKPQCGQPMHSLHVKETDGQKLFMHLEHEKKDGTDFENDPYLFTDNIRSTEYGVRSTRIAQFSAKIGQPIFTKEGHGNCHKFRLTRLYHAEKEPHRDFDYTTFRERPLTFTREDVAIIVYGTWVELDSVGFYQHDQMKITYERLPCPSKLDPTSMDCHSARTVISCSFPVTKIIAGRFLQHQWALVSPRNGREFYDCSLSYLRNGLVIPEYTKHNEQWLTIQNIKTCTTCTPRYPTILWALKKEKPPSKCISQDPDDVRKHEAKMKKQAAAPKLEPFEDPDEASNYEQMLKNRPLPICPMFRIDAVGNHHLLTFKLGINPESLAHVALGELLSNPTKLDITAESRSSSIEASWRLVTDDGTTAMPSLPRFTLLKTEDRPLSSYAQNLAHDLHEEQLNLVSWQVEQEESPPKFVEEEIMEYGITQLGYRLFARVTRPVERAGGLIAAQTGFGKTPTVISLATRRREEDLRHGHQDCTKGINSTATLIIVPEQLVSQWVSEINKFSLTAQVIVKIKSIQDLRNLTIASIRYANYVVISMGVLLCREYVFDLAQFAGMIGPEDKATSRAKDTWYKAVKDRVTVNCSILKRDPSSFPEHLEEQYMQYHGDIRNNNISVPSKRKIGAKYIPASERFRVEQSSSPSTYDNPDLSTLDAEAVIREPDENSETPEATINGIDSGTVEHKPLLGGPESDSTERDRVFANLEPSSKKRRMTSTDPTSNPEVPEKKKPKVEKHADQALLVKKKYECRGNDYLNVKFVVLEMFNFTRVVIDEAHYLTRADIHCVSSITANATWLLTATPTLDSFQDIKFIAKLLGIYLGKSDFASMPVDVIKAEIADMTGSEELHAYEAPHSPIWIQYRHGIAQRFLNLFGRRDHADKKHIQVDEFIRLVSQSAGERSAYLELEHHLAPNNFVIPRKIKSEDHFRYQINDATLKHQLGSEALLYRAGSYNARATCRDHDVLDEDCALSLHVKLRSYDLHDVLDEIKYHMRRCAWLSGYDGVGEAPQYYDFITRVREDAIGDIVIKDTILYMVEEAQKNVIFTDWSQFFCHPDCNDEKHRTCKTKKKIYPINLNMALRYLRDSVISLTTLTAESVHQQRRLRFAKTVLSINQWASKNLEELKCLKCRGSVNSLSEIMVLSRCGHYFCIQCFQTLVNVCPLPGMCNADVVDYEVISGNEFSELQHPPRFGRENGCKMDRVVEDLQRIASKGEKALLFVQDLRSIGDLEAAMSAANIKSSTMIKGIKSSRILSDFQKENGAATVLVLNIGDSTVSGANLTMANHVLFFSPFLTHQTGGQAQYDAAMEQARGRAVRWGQKKKVSVYQYLTARTFDVDYYEYRNNAIIKKSSTGVASVRRQASDPVKTPYSSHTCGLHQYDLE